jgi:hypothetical protein
MRNTTPGRDLRAGVFCLFAAVAIGVLSLATPLAMSVLPPPRPTEPQIQISYEYEPEPEPEPQAVEQPATFSCSDGYLEVMNTARAWKYTVREQWDLDPNPGGFVHARAFATNKAKWDRLEKKIDKLDQQVKAKAKEYLAHAECSEPEDREAIQNWAD